MGQRDGGDFEVPGSHVTASLPQPFELFSSALVEAHVRPDQKLWVGAHFIGLYPILGRRSPVWDIYPAWKAKRALQQRMLDELASVDWVLLDLRPIGGDPNMTLPVSHPLVFQVLTNEFERDQVPGAPDSLLLLERKRAR